MLRKRTIALIVLLLTIIVACLIVRLKSETDTINTKVPIQDRSDYIITEPAPPSQNNLADPDRKPDEVINDPKPSPSQNNTGSCYVGGCSSQLCSDKKDMVSTCEWRESYACFRTATCERQSDGQCGWTETPELKACIIDADSKSNIQVM